MSTDTPKFIKRLICSACKENPATHQAEVVVMHLNTGEFLCAICAPVYEERRAASKARFDLVFAAAERLKAELGRPPTIAEQEPAFTAVPLEIEQRIDRAEAAFAARRALGKSVTVPDSATTSPRREITQ